MFTVELLLTALAAGLFSLLLMGFALGFRAGFRVGRRL